MGGFSKLRDRSYYPDLLHSFYSLSWLSLSHTNSNKEDITNGVHVESNVREFLSLHPLDYSLGTPFAIMRFDSKCRLLVKELRHLRIQVEGHSSSITNLKREHNEAI
eukprot:scaffold3926_cov162-Chaetoceros_neogracile.AAC.3